MRLLKIYLAAVVFIFSFFSCDVRHSHPPHKNHKVKPIPPGHAKKIHGKKSAKHFAPGHQHRR